ncbi:hypothetical protein PHYBOEH_007349 [Phytophthora boehmeriae]|uniref:Uncharacterized protein n=1 Tax=Phytophthora boehmeriae TaxID=109152 RepID=A0A8T1X6N4_9STRA|nr:hypothetical protein PHYBOEH_007349 [Phytophthora boehmeriae]
MRAKETLQLRHQLACNGLSLRAATYDAKRHHVLAFDSHPLRPHVLRLFSLRRELKSAPLFDRQRKETRDNTPRHKKFSLFELQQQQQERLAQPPEAEVVVPSVLLAYSPTLDVFVCVYTSANRVKHSKKPLATTHSVLLLEPATLRKLILYSGPATHSLQCAHFDPWTDRLVLASHLNLGKHEEGYLLPKSPMNVVEILQLSKRLDDRNAEWPSSDFQDPEEQPRMLLRRSYWEASHSFSVRFNRRLQNRECVP